MNATLEPAHSPFGGSVAARVLRCPASVGLVAKVPAYLRRVSAYAERGTALHTAMAMLIERERSLDQLAGKTIGRYTITTDDVENALRPTYTFVVALLDAPGAEYFLERRVVFPTVPGAFGTCDVLARVGATIHIIDLKFGSGVLVRAVYPDGDEDIINAQLAFYAAAARHSLPQFFAGAAEIVLTIVQPVSIEPDAEMVSSVVVTPAELDGFIETYRAACAEARSPSPRLEKGPHCRFCSARVICPQHTAPLLDLAQFAMPVPPAAPADKDVYLRALAAGLDLVDAVKDIRRALHDQAKAALENGDEVPGYALSAGRAERQWHNEDAAVGALIRLGLARDDVIANEVVRSPAQVELRAKARGLKVPADLVFSRRSGVSLVRSENVRAPVATRSELARSFTVELEAFKEEAKHGET
jgi:Protein of unknown function (DUF2800)